MTVPTPPPSPAPARRGLLAGAALVVAASLAWFNSFGVPFLFDDGPAIVENASIRDLGKLREVLWPSTNEGETTSGRPLVNLSLALNRAAGGDHVRGYHAFNLAVHVLAGLTLFGLVRRTLRPFPGLTRHATPLAFAIAVLWLLHPLQTESVTYVVQRAEAMMGLGVLCTLYAFVRATDARQPRRWLALSVTACVLAMGCKEVAVVAPVLVLLYDRTFVAGTWAAAWRARRGYYLALAGTWLVLAALVASTGGRGGTAGFATTITPWDYLLTQCGAIMRYLRLTFWPSGLVFDYGTAVARDPVDVLLPALLLLALAAAAGWAVVRRPAWGFAGCWFFALLAPSSSVVPVASQTIAEHRIYLALAAPVAVSVLTLHRVLGRGALPACLALAIAAGCLTARRNADYRSALALWTDTVAKYPTNARAHHNLGLACFDAGRFDAARTHYEDALRLRPDVAETHYNLGNSLRRLGRNDEARAHYEKAVALRPTDARMLNNLGNVVLELGRPADARPLYERAIALRPDAPDAHTNLGHALLELGDTPGALRASARALQLDPGFAEAHFLAGNASAAARRLADARTHYEAALRLRPDYAEVRGNLANVFLELDRPDDAIGQLTAAIRSNPNLHSARRTLALLLLGLRRPADALPHLEYLARATPTDPEIAQALRAARGAAGKQ